MSFAHGTGIFASIKSSSSKKKEFLINLFTANSNWFNMTCYLQPFPVLLGYEAHLSSQFVFMLKKKLVATSTKSMHAFKRITRFHFQLSYSERQACHNLPRNINYIDTANGRWFSFSGLIFSNFFNHCKKCAGKLSVAVHSRSVKSRFSHALTRDKSFMSFMMSWIKIKHEVL